MKPIDNKIFSDLRIGEYFQADIYCCCLFCKINVSEAVIVEDVLFGENNDRVLSIQPTQKVSPFRIISPMGMPGFVIYNVDNGWNTKTEFNKDDHETPQWKITYERKNNSRKE